MKKQLLFFLAVLLAFPVAAKPDDGNFQPFWLENAEIRGQHRASDVQYDYKYLKSKLNPTTVSVRMSITNTDYDFESIRVRAEGYKLSHSTELFQQEVSGELIEDESGKPYITFILQNLESNTAYGFTFAITDDSGDTLLDNSPDLYTVTSGPTELDQMRASLVMTGLEEWDHYGKRGTAQVSGVRYGAGSGEAWCSEYYAWVADHGIKGIVGSTWVGDLQKYFKNYSSEYAGSEIQTKATAADYLSMWGTQHSGMFIAFEKTPQQSFMWTVEGNVGGRLRVLRREYKSSSFRLGHIIQEQLK